MVRKMKVIKLIPVFIIFSYCILYTQEPFSIKVAIHYALNNSIKLATLKSRVESSKLIIHERWRDLLPYVTIQYTKNDEVAIHEEDIRNQSLLCTANYDIFTNKRALIAYSIAKLESFLSIEEYAIEKNNIILSTKKAYYDLQKKKKAIEIYNLLLDSLHLQKKIIIAQQKLGMATDLEQIQIDGKIAEAQYNIITAQNDYSNRLKDFATTLAVESSIIVVNEPSYTEIANISLPSKERLIWLSLQNRNELKKSHYTVIKTEKEYALAEYYYLPKIQLFASYGYMGNDYPPNKKTWNIGISITSALLGNTVTTGQTYGKKDNENTTTLDTNASVQIYNEPDYIRNIVDAEAAYTEAKKTFDQLKRIIESDVSKAYDNLIESRKKIEIAQQNTNLLEKQALIENEQVRLGDITRYDVMKTLVELSQARLRLQETLTDVYLAMAALENAIGLPIESLFQLDINE
jgi:outer membrane protein TolC